MRYAALLAAFGAQAVAAPSARAFDAVLSWSRVSSATSYNVYVRYDSKAFVKGTGPDGSNIPSSLVAAALGAPEDGESIDGVFTSLASGAVHYLITGLPLGPRIFFTVTAQDATVTDESGHSNEMSIDYSDAARVVDSDGDGLTDAQEDKNLNRKRDTGETDRLSADTDGDTLSDGKERDLGMNPLSADSDSDGVSDATDRCFDLDYDGYGAPGIAGSTCPIDNCPAIANRQQYDSDADGMGEVCDPCTNVGAKQNFTFKPKLVLRKINTDLIAGDDVVVIKGAFHLPSKTAFGTTNPLVKGARLVVESREGETILDVAVPPGAFGNRGQRRGWKGSKTFDVWKYLDKTGSRIEGISKVVFKDLSGKDRRLVGVVIRGKGGDYPVLPGDPPVNASVTMGDSGASQAGQCGETSFVSRDCGFVTGGRILACETD